MVGKVKGANGTKERIAPMEDELCVIVLTDTDDDDFLLLADGLEFKKNCLIVSDKTSSASYKGKAQVLIDGFSSPESVSSSTLSWAKERGMIIKAVIGYDEEFHYRMSQRIAIDAGVRHHTYQTLDCCSNKFLQREALTASNVPCPKHVLIDDTGMIISHDEMTDTKGKVAKEGKKISGLQSIIGFPLVIKVLTGYASSFVYRCDDEGMLKVALADYRSKRDKDPDSLMWKMNGMIRHGGKTKPIDTKHNLIAEELLVGDEYSCDYIIQKDGSARVVRVVRKITLPGSGFGFFDGFLLSNPDNEPGFSFKTKELEKLCSAAGKALGIKHGTCMMDFVNTSLGLKVIETTVRPGVATFIEAMRDVYSYITLNLAVRDEFGITLDQGFKIPKKTGMVVYLTAVGEGNVTGFDVSKLIKAKQNMEMIGSSVVLNVVPYYSLGDKVSTSQTDKTRPKMMGYVVLFGGDCSNMRKIINDVRARADIMIR